MAFERLQIFTCSWMFNGSYTCLYACNQNKKNIKKRNLKKHEYEGCRKRKHLCNERNK